MDSYISLRHLLGQEIDSYLSERYMGREEMDDTFRQGICQDKTWIHTIPLVLRVLVPNRYPLQPIRSEHKCHINGIRARQKPFLYSSITLLTFFPLYCLKSFFDLVCCHETSKEDENTSKEINHENIFSKNLKEFKITGI